MTGPIAAVLTLALATIGLLVVLLCIADHLTTKRRDRRSKPR